MEPSASPTWKRRLSKFRLAALEFLFGIWLLSWGIGAVCFLVDENSSPSWLWLGCGAFVGAVIVSILPPKAPSS